jgi:thiol:disulfide interchange protein DsbD
MKITFPPFCAALFLSVFLAPALPVVRGQVQATLVAADTSILPGQPFTVALRLVQDPQWHTYWTNPGTGLATSLAWALPAGWKAGDIRWPSPKTIVNDQGAVTGNGYEGQVLLPVTITPPPDAKPGATVELKATADWLMCKDVCMPGEAAVSLTLPIASSPPKKDPQWGDAIRAVLAALPRPDPTWTIATTRDGKSVTLTIAPSGYIGHKPHDLHFFADDNYVAYELPQAVKEDGKRGFVMTLAISPDGPKDQPRLTGVLTAENGWLPSGSLPGLRVDVAFGSATPEVAAAPGAVPPPGASDAPVRGGLAGTLLLAFVGGLILNLMPCVFPVLGIKILGFVGQSGTDRNKVVAHGLVFTLGVLVSFWALAGLLIALRASGDQLGWGFQLQSPGFIFCLAAGMLVFALNLSGVFEFGLSATGVGSGLQMKTGFSGSFFTGVLATLVATPCSAPFLAPALGAALALSAVQSLAVFTAIAVGLSTPYLLLSAFPGAVKLLPRPGAWMESFKQFMAFPLYATVGYLSWVLAGQVTESGQLAAVFGLVLVAMGVWVYGRWHGAGASAGRARFGLIAGLGLVAFGTWTGWPQAPAPTDVVWDKWSPETVATLRSADRMIYVDFTARWCATCQANKRLVFHSAEVLRTFRDEHIATLRGDWTNRDPQITAELTKYNRSAVPFDLIWIPGNADPVILPELLTPETVLSALREKTSRVGR